MTTAILQMKPVGNFFRNKFFNKPIVTHDVEVVDLDIYKGQRKVAPYTRATSKSKPLSRTSFTTGGFKIPYIKLNRSLAAAETILKRPLGEHIYTTKTPAELAAEQVAKDLFEIEESIARAEELQAAQAIITGLIVIKGEEVDAEINLGRDAALTFTAGTLWSGAADIHANLRTWGRLVFEKSGFTPNVMIAAPDVLDVFFANAGVRAILDNRRISPGNINTNIATQYPGARYYGEFAGYEIWEYYELYLDDADNTEKALVPANHIILASEGMECIPHYGVIQDFGSLIPVKRFAKSIMEEDPSVRTAIVQSAPAFINHRPDATAKIKVL